MHTHDISLDYGTEIIHGRVLWTPSNPKLVLVDLLDGYAGSLPGYHAAGALRSAVRDGRIKLPDAIAAAIEMGAVIQ